MTTPNENNWIHLIPQVVIDCAESIDTNKNENIRINYIMRIEAIRDYCDAVVKKANEPKWMQNPIRKKSVSK